jgi:hypothetical protein
MANHAWVKSRRKMSPEKIGEILADLNKRLFKGNLQIEYHEATDKEPGWGEHTWILTYVSPENKQEYVRRACWLESPRHFEIRHGGGANFAWWIDFAVTNEVACFYNGTWTDEGTMEPDKGTPGKYDNWRKFLRHMCTGFRQKKNTQLTKALMQMELEICPPEFRFDLGPKIDIQVVFKKEVERDKK